MCLRTPKAKLAASRRAEVSERARRRFRELRRRGETSRYTVGQQSGQRVACPSDLRLLWNTEPVLRSLGRCRSHLEAGEHVVLELEDVQCLDLSAALLLTALLNTKWPGGALLTTTIPKKHRVMNFLADSGLLSHVGWVTTNGRPPPRVAARMAQSSGLVEKAGRIEVAAVLAEGFTTYVKSNFGDGGGRGTPSWRAGRSVYKILVELMNNTAQHAGTPGTQRWWAAARRSRRGAVELAFLDLGRGVVRTLRPRLSESVKKFVGRAASDDALLSDLMHGRLQHILTRSATGLPSRGNGFQEMRRAVADQAFSSLTIAANGALCRLLPSSTTTASVAPALAGTLVHFVVPA